MKIQNKFLSTHFVNKNYITRVRLSTNKQILQEYYAN